MKNTFTFTGAYLNGHYSGYVNRAVISGTETEIRLLLCSILIKAGSEADEKESIEALSEKIQVISGKENTIQMEWIDFREPDIKNRNISGIGGFRLAHEPETDMYCAVIESVGTGNILTYKDLYQAMRDKAGDVALYCIGVSTTPYEYLGTEIIYSFVGKTETITQKMPPELRGLIDYALYIREWCSFDISENKDKSLMYYVRLKDRLSLRTTNEIRQELNANIEKSKLAAAKYAAFDLDRGIENEIAVLMEIFSSEQFDYSMITDVSFGDFLYEKASATRDKALIAMFRLTYDEDISDEQRKLYLKTVKRSKKPIIRGLNVKGRTAQLRRCLDLKIVSSQEVRDIVAQYGEPLFEKTKALLERYD